MKIGTVAELLERIDSRELTEWSVLFDIKTEEAEQERTGGIVQSDVFEPGEADDEDDELNTAQEAHLDELDALIAAIHAAGPQRPMED